MESKNQHVEQLFEGKLQKPQAQTLHGVYDATVESVTDSDQLKRYRVRVHAIHPLTIPAEKLPFAQMCLMGGKQWGDFVSYDVGDSVFVMFKGGLKTRPVIMGGILTKSLGVHDLPPEIQADYDANERKWCRIDRAGNMVEMNPLPGEEGIRLKSGATEIRLSKAGEVQIQTSVKMDVNANNYTHKSSVYTIQYDQGMMQVAEFFSVLSDDQVDVHATNNLNLGSYRPVLWPLTPERKTDKVNIRAATKITEISEKDIFRQSLNNTIDDQKGSYKRVTLKTNDVISGQKMTVKVKTGGYDTIVEAGDLTVDVTTGNLTADVGAGKADVTVMGAVTVKSQTAINLEAPTISIKGTASIKMQTPMLDIKGDSTKMSGQMMQATYSMVKVNGSGMVIIDGGLIKVG